MIPNCTLFDKYLQSKDPISFETSSSGRAPSDDPTRSFGYAVGNCPYSNSTVIVAVPSGEPPGNPKLQFVGKTLTLTAAITSDASFRLLPEERVVQIGESLQLTAVAPEVENPVFKWEATGGIIDLEGLYTAGPLPGDFDVTVTILQTGDYIVGNITIEGTAISISPASATLSPGRSTQFSAKVVGPVNTQATWSAQGGTIDNDGLYTAGDSEGDFVITAASVADPTVTAIAQVRIEGQTPVDLSGRYTGSGIDYDYGECGSVGGVCVQYPVELVIEQVNDQFKMTFVEGQTAGGMVYTGQLNDYSYTGISTSSSQCFRDGAVGCAITGSFTANDTGFLIEGSAVWATNCECYLEFNVRRE